VQSFSDGPSNSESCSFSQKSNPYLVDEVIMPMQYSTGIIPILRGDASPHHVVLHPIQPAVMPMQSLNDTTSVLGGDASLDHVVSHPIQPTIKMWSYR
jgi:hypothetical protein